LHTCLLHLGEVIGVIHPDAVEMRRVGDARQQRDVRQIMIRFLASEFGGLAEAGCRNQRDH
jgi:hypothetical protein